MSSFSTFSTTCLRKKQLPKELKRRTLLDSQNRSNTCDVGHDQICCRSYLSPVSQDVQIYDPSSIHTTTRRIDHHGNRRADITAGAGLWVCLMKPDAHWDIIFTSCQKINTSSKPGQIQDKRRTCLQQEDRKQTFMEDRNGPCQVDQPLLLFVWKTCQKVNRSPSAETSTVYDKRPYRRVRLFTSTR